MVGQLPTVGQYAGHLSAVGSDIAAGRDVNYGMAAVSLWPLAAFLVALWLLIEVFD